MLRGNRPARGGGARLDNQLHAYLIEKAGNPDLRDRFDRHGIYYATLLDHAAPEAQVVAEMADQHRQILSCADRSETGLPCAGAGPVTFAPQQPIIEKLLAQMQDQTAGRTAQMLAS